MKNENGNIVITAQQAQQISMILNQLPINELGKVEAIVKIFNGQQEEGIAEEVAEDIDEVE
tara:strand:+ start:124 stop:306 length:183 start_codon:yes stop_codon:yes gene_type:complete